MKGIASRREAEKWIMAGRGHLNGKLLTNLGTLVDPNEDQISVDGSVVTRDKPPLVYWMLNKPDYFLTSRKSNDDKQTIYELPTLKKIPFLVSPVGRLDYKTEGLLLMSNDGNLVHRLSHPSWKLPRHYQVLVNGRLTEEEEDKIRTGLVLEDGAVKDVQLKHSHGKNLGKSRGSWYFISVMEGRNRLVRRIFEHFDKKVVRLVRYGFGDLRLDSELLPGSYRQLKSCEIRALKKATNLIN